MEVALTAAEVALREGRRYAILALQSAIKDNGLDVGAASCPVEHFFAPGSYGRQITMPAGMVVVGKIHKHAHINVISKGRVRVFTEQEGEQELIAPCTFVSSPLTKRVVVIDEATVWTTFHLNPTNTRDLAVLERDIIHTEL